MIINQFLLKYELLVYQNKDDKNIKASYFTFSNRATLNTNAIISYLVLLSSI